MRQETSSSGFTLVELSIVLVIIGLIIGGILVGRDLLAASRTRAQVSQIEKYRSAVNTFQIKYNALPGDMDGNSAANFGMVTRDSSYGNGDNDGFITTCGVLSPHPFPGIIYQGCETLMFWADLSSANLVDGSFAMPMGPLSGGALYNKADVPTYIPSAKIGNANVVPVAGDYEFNYFYLTTITSFNVLNPRGTYSIPVQQASQIDQKLDDGVPNTGRTVSLKAAPTGIFNLIDDSVTGTCTINSGANYNLSVSSSNCALRIMF